MGNMGESLAHGTDEDRDTDTAVEVEVLNDLAATGSEDTSSWPSLMQQREDGRVYEVQYLTI